jgi:4-hydroxy-2-oxoglutarate aldolase
MAVTEVMNAVAEHQILTNGLSKHVNGIHSDQYSTSLNVSTSSKDPAIVNTVLDEKASIPNLTPEATTASVPQVPPSGVWAPAITFFDHSTDTLDTDAQAKYYSYLSKCGLAGLVILGTNAETFLLTREERKTLLETARKACGPSYPIMAGVGGHSTKQVLEFIADAADAGANYVLLLPPAYFGKQTTPAVIDSFFNDVAKASALPIVIYNFPTVCNGIDLDSATITRLAKTHSNIVGVKLTCGAVAKITRLSAELPADRFATFGGQSDFLIGGLAAGSMGTIAGFANVFPKTIVHIYDLYQDGKFQEAMELHKKAALAEQPCKAGIASVKYAAALNTAKAAGIEDALEKLKPRRPYIETSEAERRVIESQIAGLVSIETSL